MVDIVVVRRAQRGQTPEAPLGTDWDKKPRFSADRADAGADTGSPRSIRQVAGRPPWMAQDATQGGSWAPTPARVGTGQDFRVTP
jgi:hypothetical protein